MVAAVDKPLHHWYGSKHHLVDAMRYGVRRKKRHGILDCVFFYVTTRYVEFEQFFITVLCNKITKQKITDMLDSKFENKNLCMKKLKNYLQSPLKFLKL